MKKCIEGQIMNKTVLTLFIITAVLVLLSIIPSVAQSPKKETTFTVVQRDGRYFLAAPNDSIIFPVGLNHLNIHELQQQIDTLQTLGEDELNAVLYRYLTDWGFTSSGYDRVHTLNNNHNILHYVKTEILSLASYHGEPVYRDIFDSSTYAFFEQKIQPLAVYNDDPNVIGLMYSDLPRYRPTETLNWVRFYRQLPSTAPGRLRYHEFLTQKYQHDLATFNRVYRENISTISKLSSLTFENTDANNLTMLKDDAEFVSIIYRQYLQSLYELHQKYAPNLMFLSDVFGRPREWTDELIRIAGEYCDVISFQPSDNVLDTALCQRIYKLSGKPIIIADQKVSFAEAGYDNIQGDEVATEALAATGYTDYLIACFDSPIVVGYNRCMFKSKFRPGGVLKQGLLDFNGDPYSVIVESVVTTNREIIDAVRQLNQSIAR